MNRFEIWLIAIITMTIDHIGVILYPDIELFRIIGRLAMPLFVYMLIQGFVYTKNLKNYLIRLIAIAIPSELVFDLIRSNHLIDFGRQSIIFTLIACLILLIILKNNEISNFKKVISIIGMILLTNLCRMDYAVIAILLTTIFYTYNDEKKELLKTSIVAIVIYSLLTNWVQLYSLLALPLIMLYNNKQGIKLKHLNYLYYPLHLIVLYSISLLT